MFFEYNLDGKFRFWTIGNKFFFSIERQLFVKKSSLIKKSNLTIATKFLFINALCSRVNNIVVFECNSVTPAPRVSLYLLIPNWYDGTFSSLGDAYIHTRAYVHVMYMHTWSERNSTSGRWLYTRLTSSSIVNRFFPGRSLLLSSSRKWDTPFRPARCTSPDALGRAHLPPFAW